MNWITLLTIGHILGVAFGVGGAAVSDAFFFRFLKKGTINLEALETIKLVSKIVIAGLSILIATGIGFIAVYYFVYDSTTLFSSPWFQAKMTIVAFLTANGIIFHKKVLPLFFRNVGKSINDQVITSKIWLLAITGAFSVTSWYSALILGITKNAIKLSYLSFMGIYLFIVLGGIFTGFVVLSMMIRKVGLSQVFKKDSLNISFNSNDEQQKF